MQPVNVQTLRSPDARNLFGTGFLILFLELALIRYLAGNIWNLGYFPNLVLIAVFIGMAVGFMFHHYVGVRASGVLVHAGMVLLCGLVVFVHYLHPAVPGFGSWEGDVDGDLYFTASRAGAEGSTLLFVVCLLGIAAIFACLSQRAAKLFRSFRPLTAYTLDISGSCAGILSFILISWLHVPAWVWFGLATALFVAVTPGSWRSRWLPMVPGLALAALVWQQDRVLLSQPDYAGPLETAWSPYQRVQFQGDRHSIFVNGVGHQSMWPGKNLERGFYSRAHAVRRESGVGPYRNVLILGAGSGNDVATALMHGAEHVDAVEIDPVIAGLGKRHHPLQPYKDPRVNLVIDDGRAFMSRTERRYDMIVFALTDSLVKVSSMSQLRLENYLFTAEAVGRARQLLKPGGDILFYNFYRQPWLREKIEQLIREAAGIEPETIFAESDFAVVRAHDGNPVDQDRSVVVDLPRDDWPFLYLFERTIPTIYQWAMLAMLGFVAALTAGLHLATRRAQQYGKTGMLATKLAFAGMGVAFLLLETKSIIQFSLLFGTTWLNNSLVFLAVLLFVLVANWVASLIRPRWMPLVYTALIASCLATFVFPLAGLLQVQNAGLRFVLASVLTFAPIFCANLVFSVTFRDQDVPEHVFGWNLIGATLGGVLEYTSMAFGYSFLALVVAALYAVVVALLLLGRRARATVGASAVPTDALPSNAAHS